MDIPYQSDTELNNISYLGSKEQLPQVELNKQKEVFQVKIAKKPTARGHNPALQGQLETSYG
jgi:hypothetical protein